jgi:hypothetical protein
MQDEQLKVTEAWEYFIHRTGVDIERRAFFSWIECGIIRINGQEFRLDSNQIGKTHFVSRHSIDQIIEALKPLA